nr:MULTISPECIES: SRPBCC family protein [Streptomyces]
MAQVEAETERIVAADAETVFDTLADYSGTREKLLPEHFSEYEVREGGDGEGTLVHWKLQATSKRVRDCLLEVTEPSDGELVEKDRNSSMVTTWRVTPAGEGKSRVVVHTVWQGAGGVGGLLREDVRAQGAGPHLRRAARQARRRGREVAKRRERDGRWPSHRFE